MLKLDVTYASLGGSATGDAEAKATRPARMKEREKCILSTEVTEETELN
jgi:hypothetical protein